MKNKISYLLIAILVAAITLFSSFAFTGRAQEISPESSTVVTSTTKSFVYIITNPSGSNAVAAYARNPQTGRLKFIASYPTGGIGEPRALAVSQDSLVTNGRYLYAVNPGSNDISGFAIQNDGSLQLVSSPVPSGGLSPVSLALHGQLLYVANQGDPSTPANLSGFIVNNGSLAPLDNSTVTLNFNDGPGDVLFNKAGNLLIDTREASSIIDSYKVDSSGRLSQAGKLGSQAGPIGAAFSPIADKQLLVSLSTGFGDGSYLLSDQGDISLVSKVVNYPDQDPCWVRFSTDGTYAWFSNFFASSVSLYKVNAQGELSFVSRNNTAAFGLFSSDIALDSAGKYLYQSKPLPVSPKINVLRVLPLTDKTQNGGLAEMQTVDVPAGSSPIGLVVIDL